MLSPDLKCDNSIIADLEYNLSSKHSVDVSLTFQNFPS